MRNNVAARSSRPAGVAARMRNPRPRIETRGSAIRVTNREIIFTVDRTFTGGFAPAGSQYRLMAFRNTPDAGISALGNTTWVGRMAGMYDKFRVIKAELEYVPSVAFTYSGQVGITTDADWNALTTMTFPQLSGQRYARTAQVSQPMRLNVPQEVFNRLPWYDTSLQLPSDGDGVAAMFRLVTSQLVAPLVNATPVTLNVGVAWMNYVIEFDVPSNPASQTPAAAVTVETAPVAAASLKEAVKGVIDNWGSVKKTFEDVIPDDSSLNSAASNAIGALGAILAASLAKANRKEEL